MDLRDCLGSSCHSALLAKDAFTVGETPRVKRTLPHLLYRGKTVMSNYNNTSNFHFIEEHEE